MAMVEMNDGARLRTWDAGAAGDDRLPVVTVHGGPGVRDYLEPVSHMVEDLTRVHRYDQRGVGGSTWAGSHTIARHVEDLRQLLEAWSYDSVVLVGHSFGTDLATFFLLAHPDRVAGIVYLSGPFVGPWREPTRATERARRSDPQQARLDRLERIASRTEDEEIEFLALSWFPDHADARRAWEWALESARTSHPINYAMNAQLNADKRVDPLEVNLDRLRELLPAGAAIIGGEGDPRPASFLRQLASRLDCDVTIIPGAGHDPWMEEPAQFRSALRDAVARQLRRAP